MTIAAIRKWHFYIGTFIAPSVLFFTLTGAAQLFSLHESHGAYHPPALLEKLSSVHKDQVYALGDHHPQPTAGTFPAAAPAPPSDDDKVTIPALLLKFYFLIVALGLATSTSLGLWIGLTRAANKRAGWLLALAGTLIPVGLLVLS